MSETNTIRLEALTTKIGSGATPRGGAEAYKESSITLIRSLNVYDSVFQRDGLAFIDDEQADGLRNVIVEPDDVLLNITGASVARCCMVPRSVLPARVNQHVAIVRADKAKADPQFVCYCMVSPRYKDALLSIAQGGATREALTKEKIQNFEIPDVPLHTQRKIASILSAYDDLIENNTRRIAILEEMAQAIYREWFVHFRFPGHEKVKLVDSPLGQIPEGWEASRFGDVATFENGDRGKNYPKSSQFVDEGVPFINAGHLAGGIVNVREVNRIDDATFARLSRGKVKSGDLLLCVRGSLRRIARVGTLNEGAIASSLVIIRDSNAVGKAYLYYTLSGPSGQQMVAELDNGVAQPNISVQSIKRYPILVPSLLVRDTFEELMHPIWEEGRLLHSKCSNLRTTRDLLLPKLISGKLDVEDLDIDVGMTAEALEEATA